MVVIDQQIDTSTPTRRLTFHLLAAIDEFERDLINERTSDGRTRAMANGVKFGRSRALDDDQVSALVAEINSGKPKKKSWQKNMELEPLHFTGSIVNIMASVKALLNLTD
ncbi:MAG: recombinase family protein [Deltaproteobacteria bacterium]|nr:recombinase family protein [Deltaproteobacteria bacterium]